MQRSFKIRSGKIQNYSHGSRLSTPQSKINVKSVKKLRNVSVEETKVTKNNIMRSLTLLDSNTSKEVINLKFEIEKLKTLDQNQTEVNHT